MRLMYEGPCSLGFLLFGLVDVQIAIKSKGALVELLVHFLNELL